MATEFEPVVDNSVDDENRNDTDFSWETTYDGPYDREGNPDPEDRDDQDFTWQSTPESPSKILNIRGASLDVLNGLNAIAFLPGSMCGMSESFAYIRYWSRGSSSRKTPVNQPEERAEPEDPQAKLDEEVTEKYVREQQQQEQEQQEANLRPRTVLRVPENTVYQSRPRQPVPTQLQPQTYIPPNKTGSTYSANPSGSVETVASSLPADAVWTFLFNPEELKLSSGPEYNRAEAWGVADEENSGQPLSWRSNRNRKLSFDRILLHGYSFGKRVDSLEKGLQDLFMSRTGESGNDGPPVLEFVWGKRTFGPCVIQNIQVREKSWDKGLLVNAEVSFELEQVPEWTINDGFVDVLRPGRQPTVNDPLVPARTREAGSTEPEVVKGDEDDKKPSKGGKPPVPGDPDKCLRVQRELESWRQVDKKAGEELGSIFTGKDKYETIATYYSNAYGRKLKELDLRPYLEKENPDCLKLYPGVGFLPDHRRAVAYIHTCTRRIVGAYNAWLIKEGKSGGRCVALKNARLAKEKEESAKKKAQEEAKRCERYDNDKPCTNTQLRSRISCLGVTRACVRRNDGFFWTTLGG